MRELRRLYTMANWRKCRVNASQGLNSYSGRRHWTSYHLRLNDMTINDGTTIKAAVRKKYKSFPLMI